MKNFCLFTAILFGALLCPGPLSAKTTSPAPSADSSKEILENQKEILKQLDEIKKELEVIKIRATR